MKSAGVDAGDLSEAYLKVEQMFPLVSFERPSDPTALPEWADAVAFEKKVAAADWACREPRLDKIVSAATDDLQKFTTTNTARITRVADGWKAMPSLAQTLRTTVKTTPAK
ncbi:hypothetical protein [Micromonospora sp. CNB394]|uniref:hypothetical protein n=1 Tax=Micromonospora sp. CNB394 TaxID=1169151 RepID=UPI000371C07B|nr:hypothetical protein [Micromonospora sp. CNB394]